MTDYDEMMSSRQSWIKEHLDSGNKHPSLSMSAAYARGFLDALKKVAEQNITGSFAASEPSKEMK